MNVEQFDGFFATLIAGPEIQRGSGVCFSYGQERDQFPKVDRAFSVLGLWHRSFAAGDSLCSLRLPHSVKRVDVRARRPIRPAAAGPVG